MRTYNFSDKQFHTVLYRGIIRDSYDLTQIMPAVNQGLSFVGDFSQKGLGHKAFDIRYGSR
jgi:hypothetical protein